MNIIFFRAFYSRIGCSWTRFNLERGVGFSWNSPLWSSAVSPVANGRAKTPVTRVTRPAKRQQETRVLFFSSSFTPPPAPCCLFLSPTSPSPSSTLQSLCSDPCDSSSVGILYDSPDTDLWELCDSALRVEGWGEVHFPPPLALLLKVPLISFEVSLVAVTLDIYLGVQVSIWSFSTAGYCLFGDSFRILL